MIYITASIFLSVTCLMTVISEFINDTTDKTIMFEIYIIFMSLTMFVMLYILNGLANKIYMEE